MKNCPKCGAELRYKPHPTKPGVVIANCPCNPLGPVVEGLAAVLSPATGIQESVAPVQRAKRSRQKKEA